MNIIDQRIELDRSARTHPRPVLWFEVEDFLRYFDHFRNPTGLQRVAFEIYLEAERLYGRTGRVRFCRLSVYSKQFVPIGFDAIIAAFTKPPGANAPWKTIWAPARFWREFSSMLPIIVRHPRFFVSIIHAAVRDLAVKTVQRRSFERSVRSGDVVVALGAPWGAPNYLKYVAEAKRRYGIRFVTMIHDLIPVENSSLVEPWHVVQFRNWLREAISNADMVFTTSNYSRSALIAFAANKRLSLPPIEVLQLGAAMSDQPNAEDQSAIEFPRRFVLFVSTIEIRKNHQLLVRVWRRLLERHGPDAVPMLVFAGQMGWSVDDLLADLAATDHVDGKIVLISNVSDAQLRQAYRSCLFTIFPSLCEGWGLPIAESLVQGKLCVASNRTSMPEVGGDFVDYFDPSNEDDALLKIERLLLDPDYLARREARLRLEYRPPEWADCVHSLVAKLDWPLPLSEEARYPRQDSSDAARR